MVEVEGECRSCHKCVVKSPCPLCFLGRYDRQHTLLLFSFDSKCLNALMTGFQVSLACIAHSSSSLHTPVDATLLLL